MRTILAALLLWASSASAQTYNMQWLHCQKVPPYTSISLEGKANLNAASFAWPYTVPDGYVLGITDIQFSSKFTTTGRASYLVLLGVMSVPDSHSSVHFRTPIALPAGTFLSANIINNDDEEQWMCAAVTGLLVKVDPGIRWTQVFGSLKAQ